MLIKFRHNEQGAFIAGDEFTGATCYAYPSSSFAKSARKDARKIAIKMLTKEVEFRRTVTATTLATFREADQRNWKCLTA